MARLDTLPSEIVLHITLFLESIDIVTLQLVCKRLLELARDNTLWREQCFYESSFLEKLRRRREIIASESVQEPQFRDLALALSSGNGLGDSRLVQTSSLKAQALERVRILANWDPSYTNEKVNWYDEYISRNAPISMSWMQQPQNQQTPEREYLEARGMALYTPPGQTMASSVVAPLEDGSICLFDMSGSHGRKGRIIARSNRVLSDGRKTKSKLMNTGVTECISVDSNRGRIYVAVQDRLMEIDLETLSPISREKYPFSITALSEARHPIPLTVGTNLSLHFHDSRNRKGFNHNAAGVEQFDHLDVRFGDAHYSRNASNSLLNNPKAVSPYAHLHQPSPLSILHMPKCRDMPDNDDDIYVAGRFPSILDYDRRNFPKLKGTMYSGARLCSMASLPYPFASMEKDLARRGELSVEQISEYKSRKGKTLIACGEYCSKGSLEIFGLSPDPISPKDSTMKNRQTSSSSKLLSVSNHGTRIVVSDGSGNLKWFERDGFTEVRRFNMSHGSPEAPRGIFGNSRDFFVDSGSGDIARKLLQRQTSSQAETPLNEDNLVVWTGEKIGLLSFTSKPGSTADRFEENVKSVEEAYREREEQVHSATMRRALELQANEVFFLRSMGHG